jgi:hypothetical protein
MSGCLEEASTRKRGNDVLTNQLRRAARPRRAPCALPRNVLTHFISGPSACSWSESVPPRQANCHSRCTFGRKRCRLANACFRISYSRRTYRHGDHPDRYIQHCTFLFRTYKDETLLITLQIIELSDIGLLHRTSAPDKLDGPPTFKCGISYLTSSALAQQLDVPLNDLLWDPA